MGLSATDLRMLRAAIALAGRARDRGDQPHGALLADTAGRILLEAQNTEVSEGDFTCHAETNLLRLAAGQLDPTILAACTLYASTEPCPMCAGAIQMSPIKRVVYALGTEQLLTRAGRPASRLLSCREILERSGRPVEVLGPALEDEALVNLA